MSLVDRTKQIQKQRRRRVSPTKCKIWTGGPDWLDCEIISEDWNLHANTVSLYGYHKPDDEYTTLGVSFRAWTVCRRIIVVGEGGYVGGGRMPIVGCVDFSEGGLEFLNTFGDALEKYSSPGVIPIPIIRVHIDVLARKLPLPTACYLPVSSASHSPTSALTLLFASSTSPASRSPLLQTYFAAGCQGVQIWVWGCTGVMFWGEKVKEAVRAVERGSRGRNINQRLQNVQRHVKQSRLKQLLPCS